ncbi:MAG: hypothetical protein ACO331_09945 [Prochlorothrix sp.]
MQNSSTVALSQSSVLELVPQLAQASFFTLAMIGEFRYAVAYFDHETTPRLFPVGVPVGSPSAAQVQYSIAA